MANLKNVKNDISKDKQPTFPALSGNNQAAHIGLGQLIEFVVNASMADKLEVENQDLKKENQDLRNKAFKRIKKRFKLKKK